MSHIHMPAAPSLNPKGWQEVDGVKLPPITWADRASLCICATPDACTCKSQERFDWRLASMTDEQLEEVFQAWLHASTKPQNLSVYRTLLRDRIEEMVQRGHQHDLRRDF